MIALFYTAFIPLWHRKCQLFTGCSDWTVNAPLLKGLGYFFATLFGESILYIIIFFILLCLTRWRWPDKRLFIFTLTFIWIPGALFLRIAYPYFDRSLATQIANSAIYPLMQKYEKDFEKVEVGMSRSEVYGITGDPYVLHPKIQSVDERYGRFHKNKSATGWNDFRKPFGRNGEFAYVLVFDAEYANAYADNREQIVYDLVSGESMTANTDRIDFLVDAFRERRVTLAKTGMPKDFFGEEFFYGTVKPFFKAHPDRKIVFDDCEYFLGGLLCFKDDKVILKAGAWFSAVRPQNAGYYDSSVFRYILNLKSDPKHRPVSGELFQ